jgi:EutQ-like cupin domain
MKYRLRFVLNVIAVASANCFLFTFKKSNKHICIIDTIRSSSTSTTCISASANVGPRPLHTKFTVEKATPEVLAQLDVMRWPTWSTDGSPKYKVGKRSPLKVYDCNELSYVTKGEVDIIDAKTGMTSTVTVGDLVTFPNGYECYWYVRETLSKHWYIY